jgi:hypothetical protein
LPGNKLLRDLGFQWIDAYMTVPKEVQEWRQDVNKYAMGVRRHKFRIVKKLVKIVNQMNSVAGFVCQDPASKVWYELTDEMAWKEVKRVISFCRDLKNEGWKPQRKESSRTDDSPRAVEVAETKRKIEDIPQPEAKKRKRSDSTEEDDKSPRVSKYRCGLCGQPKRINGKSHKCTAKKNNADITDQGKYKCGLCGKLKTSGGHNCPYQKNKPSSDNKQVIEIMDDSSSSGEEEEEEQAVPDGFQAYRGGIQVFKEGDRYTAAPITKAGEPVPRKEEPAKDDDETESEKDDGSPNTSPEREMEPQDDDEEDDDEEDDDALIF